MANTITTDDGTQIYFKDWGNGQPRGFIEEAPDTVIPAIDDFIA